MLLSHLQPRRAVRRPRGARPPVGARRWSSSSREFHSVARGAVRRAPVPEDRPRRGRPPVLRRVVARLDGARRDADPRAGARGVRRGARLGAAGPMLNPLFQRAVAVGKQVMRETAIAEGRLSVASVAVDYAKRIFETFATRPCCASGRGRWRRWCSRVSPRCRRGGSWCATATRTRREPLAAKFNGAGGAVRAAGRAPRGRGHRRLVHRRDPAGHHAEAVRAAAAAAAVPADLPDRHRRAAQRGGRRWGSWTASSSTTSTTSSRSCSPTQSQPRRARSNRRSRSSRGRWTNS